jgi:FlaA1/EpsC-like NDP-sugar epimerase
MKKIETLFSVLFIPIDFILLVLAGLSAYYLRFSHWSASVRPIIFDLQFPIYFRSLLFVSLIWVIILAISGVYSIRSARKLAQEIRKIFFACAAGLAMIAIIIFFQRDLFDSRFIVLMGSVFAFLYLGVAHAFIRWLQRRLYVYGIGVHKIILVGSSKTTDNLIAEFSSNKKSGSSTKVLARATRFASHPESVLTFCVRRLVRPSLDIII